MRGFGIIAVSVLAGWASEVMIAERYWLGAPWPVLAAVFYAAYYRQWLRANSAERIKANDVVDRYMRIKDQITVTRDGEGGE